MTKADKERKIKNINLLITDACTDIRELSNNLKITEEENQRMKILRQIEDKIKDVRKFYKDIEKIEGETEDNPGTKRRDDRSDDTKNVLDRTRLTNYF